MKDEHDNRRRDVRLRSQISVVIDLHPTVAGGGAREQVTGTSIDCSASGLQVKLDRPLLPGSRLRLGARQGPGLAPLQMVGEVRWLREHDDGWSVGFALLDLADTDLADWQQLVAGQLPA